MEDIRDEQSTGLLKALTEGCDETENQELTKWRRGQNKMVSAPVGGTDRARKDKAYG